MSTTATQQPTATWTIDAAHTEVGFEVKHLMISRVRGRFGAVEGTVRFGDDPTAASVQAEIDVASIDTRQEQRDTHLRSADFFDVEQFPKMTFRSTRVERTGEGLRVVGDLTIRDVTARSCSTRGRRGAAPIRGAASASGSAPR